MADQRGFFDLDERYAALSAAGDPLVKLAGLIDFEMFRPELDRALARSDRSKGGRPPLDAVMMFRVLVLQALYGLSDAQAEYQIMDRRSFGRFLGLDEGDAVPDETTIWRFREALTQAGAMKGLFARFDEHLRQAGYLAMGGQIIDASIVAAPRQRMTEEEKRIVKGGGIPEDWKARPRKLAQKDRDARWTLKRGRKKKNPDGKLQMEIAIPVFGYKSHISTDRRHGFIRKWSVTDAAAHDGHELPGLLDKTNTASTVWADTAYRSKRNEKRIARAGLFSKVHFKKPRGKSLPDTLQRANAARSKVRSHIEHVFARQKGPMGLFIRTIGIARARTRIGMANLAYNLSRYVFCTTRLATA
jgi:IS5 family transposase